MVDLDLISKSKEEPQIPLPKLPLSFRQATREDIPAILDIVNSLDSRRERASAGGFLRARHSESDYHRYVAGSHVRLAHIEDLPVGFTVCLPWQSPELAAVRRQGEQVLWSNPDLSNPSNSLFKNMMFIDEIGVAPHFERRGIGKSLYQQLFSENPHSNTLAVVIEKPLFNSAATAFHLAMGFVRVGEYQLPEYCGLTPYQSGVYLREGIPQFQTPLSFLNH